MEKRFSFTKPKLLELPVPDDRAVYHDAHKEAAGLQLRITKTAKTFFIQKRINGKPERITIGQFPDISIENARKKAAELKGEIAAGHNPKVRKSSLTFQELFDDFLQHRRNKRGAFLAEKTKRSYRYDFGLYLGGWGKRKLSQFKDSDFLRLHAGIGKEHPTTANRVIALASSLFSYAQEKKLFSGVNPALGIKKFPENKRDRFLHADELPSFFTALATEPNDTVRDFFLVSLLTGARRSNVQEMQWSQINLDRAEWRIPTTKNGEPQTVHLTAEVVEILRGRRNCDPLWVFPGTGSTGHLVEPKKAWKRILERAGIEDLRIHDLRRTLGSWQAKTGASLAIVGKSLNHKSPSTTAIYARLDIDPIRDSVDRATGAMLTAGGLKPTGEIVPMSHRKQTK